MVSGFFGSLTAFAGLLAAGAAQAQQQQRACNGYAELCDKAYDQVVNVGAHNSYAVSRDASNLAANQAFNVTTQLRNGVRLLQGQAHTEDDTLNLCHTSCDLLDGGKLSDYLSEVKSWLDDNPNEVITLLWVNSDSQPASVWGDIYDSVGMTDYVYTPNDYPVQYGSWPTLGSLIDSNQRVISFLASGADYSSVPYLLDEFTHIWETPFNEVNDSFPCTVDRPEGDPANKMYLMNHYLDKQIAIGVVPDVDNIDKTNSEDSALSNVQECHEAHSQFPTFLLVDYYERGDGGLFEAAASLNNVTYKDRPIGEDSLSSDDQSSTNSNVDSTQLGAAVALTPSFGFASVALAGAFALALRLA